MKQAITSSLSHEHIQFLKLVLNRLPLRAQVRITLNPLRVGLRSVRKSRLNRPTYSYLPEGNCREIK